MTPTTFTGYMALIQKADERYQQTGAREHRDVWQAIEARMVREMDRLRAEVQRLRAENLYLLLREDNPDVSRRKALEEAAVVAEELACGTVKNSYEVRDGYLYEERVQDEIRALAARKEVPT